MSDTSPTKLIYSIIDRSAMKIATLIKIANLDYIIEESHDKQFSKKEDKTDDKKKNEQEEEQPCPHILITPLGELYKEYEIISYIVSQSKRISELQDEHAKERGSENERNNSSEIDGHDMEQKVNKERAVINLAGEDIVMTVKMQEKLYELRNDLFPLLHQFYKYMTGFQTTKKGKYDALMSKIKKEIGKLDKDIYQHPELYHREFNFLNIIIACEIFLAYKFVFEQKFRKSKYSLQNKYQKITGRAQFIEVHGKSQLCLKEYVPSWFEQENMEQKSKQKEKNNIEKEISPNQFLKLSSKMSSYYSKNQGIGSQRNQLLYNYFKHIFSQFELDGAGGSQKESSKKKYYPYFWLMFEELNCSLVQVVVPCQEGDNEDANLIRLKRIHTKIMGELNTELDYGIIGLYCKDEDRNEMLTDQSLKKSGSQKEISAHGTSSLPLLANNYIIRGLICLGSKGYDQFEKKINPEASNAGQSSSTVNINKIEFEMESRGGMRLHKIDYNCIKQRKQAESIWQSVLVNKRRSSKESSNAILQDNEIENEFSNNIRLCMIMNF